MRITTAFTAFLLIAICTANAYAEDSEPVAKEVTLGAKGIQQLNPAVKTSGGKAGDFYGSGPTTGKKNKPQITIDKNKKLRTEDSGSDDAEKKDLALPQASQDGVGEQSVMPEVQMKAMFSASDVNRVVCGTDIKDVTFSKEKGVMVKYSGKNAFLKFNVTKIGEKTLYAVNPVELFIICGESVYNIIAVPKRIPSQTIRLNSGILDRINKNSAIHTGQSFEKRLLEVIKSTYTDDIPDSYKISNIQKELKVFGDATVIMKREITVDGEGLILREYYVSPKENVEQLVISERDFMKEEFGNRLLAISADKLTVRKGETARVFIVDAKEATNVEQP